jgi:hypothetical protein
VTDPTQPIPANGHPLREVSLPCPHCNYNLIGCVSKRCPECGAPFDRVKLLEQMRSGKGPIPYWETPVDAPVMLRFLRTILAVMLSPGKFVRAFPAIPSLPAARRFNRHCYVLGGGILSLTLVLVYRNDPELPQALSMLLAGLISALLCQFMISSVILQANNPSVLWVRIDSIYHDALGYMFAAFVPLTAVMVAFALIMHQLLRFPVVSWPGLLAWLGVAVSVILWIRALAVVTWSFEGQLSEACVALFTLPLIMLLAIIIGGSTAMLICLPFALLL